VAASRVALDSTPTLTAAAPSLAHHRWASLGRRVVLCILGATLVALAFAAQNHASAVIEGYPADWWRAIRYQLAVWYTWALLVPPIVTLGRHYPVERAAQLARLTLWFAAGLTCIALHAAISTTVARELGWLGSPPGGVEPTQLAGIWMRFQLTAAANMLYFAMIALAVHLDAHFRASRVRAMREAQLTARLAEAELGALKMQLQPHFFFNTLNTVSSLMDSDIVGARTVLANLGDLLRLSMDRLGANETPLGDEFEFLEKYLDIQRARYGTRLRVEMRLEPDAATALVPSLILQPIVENAVRHAVEPRRAPSTIRVAAFSSAGRLYLTVDDDGPGMNGARATPWRKGVGLQNTEARLNQLYGAAQRFDLLVSPLGGLRVSIELPLRHGTSTVGQ
jgi:two-component system LytT family sensor kinase